MLINQKLVLVVLALMFFISNMGYAEDSLEREEAVDTAPAASDDQLEDKKASDEQMEDDNQLQEGTKMEDEQELAELESPEMKAVQQPSNEEAEKRFFRIRCFCWIGWVKKKSRKYINYGSIHKFKLFERRKQSKCSAACSQRCVPGLKKKHYLCKKIGKKYHYKWHKVGCFSQLGKLDLPFNIWDFDGSPHGLCCKTFLRPCRLVYKDKDFYYHSGMKLCVKYLASGPIPGIPNGQKPPICFYKNKLYACQKPQYINKPVTCW